jgi:hypothetical protein
MLIWRSNQLDTIATFVGSKNKESTFGTNLTVLIFGPLCLDLCLIYDVQTFSHEMTKYDLLKVKKEPQSLKSHDPDDTFLSKFFNKCKAAAD